MYIIPNTGRILPREKIIAIAKLDLEVCHFWISITVYNINCYINNHITTRLPLEITSISVKKVLFLIKLEMCP